ncbi:GT2 family glycosyltransferase [Mariniflexile fucanivorans]|uniref:GT2 family glycosyltransferase n=1 Tax=Mariniflexile fucanivorans TaxID=264023 RepID=A0A4R1RDK0_9FLAO|nr:glycosyltransferase [Mariniflexile fucanivorans]TCL63879.1 GT2 family glycosyltransferase [Mariniflexile fucanivorans]
MLKKGVSIVLCTYNGKERLAPTLSHLAKQKLNIPCEIIFVDNASTDGTKNFADDFWKENGNLHIAYQSYVQSIPGKSYAQELGYEKANYEYLLICDDDNWLCDTYVQNAYDVMESDDSIGALGGWCDAVFEKEKPEWFDNLSKYFAISKQGNVSGDITNKKGCLYGAGMVVRKSHWQTLQTLGFKQQLTCRKGTSLSSGGDTEHSYALRLLGYKIWFDERLYFKHFMSNSRLNLSYISRLRKGMTDANFILKPYLDLISNKEQTKNTLRKEANTLLLKHWKKNLFYLMFGNFSKKEDSKHFFRTLKKMYFNFEVYQQSKESILKWKSNR